MSLYTCMMYLLYMYYISYNINTSKTRYVKFKKQYNRPRKFMKCINRN